MFAKKPGRHAAAKRPNYFWHKVGDKILHGYGDLKAHHKTVGGLTIGIIVTSLLVINTPVAIAEEADFIVPQQLVVSSTVVNPTVSRDSITTTQLSEEEQIAAAQAYAEELVGDETEFTCLKQLWYKESGWRVDAENEESLSYGIPQSLPAEKMADFGADYRTNYKTQIQWGLWYIANSSYKTPCVAWQHSQDVGWY